MSRLAWPAWILLVACSARAGDFDDFSWHEPCTSVERWTPLPSWLANPSPTAPVTSEAETVCFAVDEPGRGMKWSASMPAISLADLPYLVIRYRAENLVTNGTDYFVHLDDHAGAELHALRLSDVVADGRWHVAAVDLTTLTRAEAVHRIDVRVQAIQA
ncbi:MAG: hypothetical protein ABIP48_17050, partial [Planctomycetota bacterium]